jgi:4-diphosphocytidyl-2-C-methyl-D-erythritol kinase
MEYRKQRSKVKSALGGQISNIKLLAPAKINVGLLVKEKLPSGYHKIETIMVPIKLFDTITISRAKKGLYFKTNSKKIPSDEDNLVMKAAKLFFQAAKIKSGAKIYLKKKIPIEAGLGGGSSDAASTLLGLNRIHRHILNLKQLHALATNIGMDVPFFLYQKPCYATGRGEILRPVSLPKFDILLYVPNYGISTKWAYHNIGAGLTDSSFSLIILKKKLIQNDLFGINVLVSNTFEGVVFSKHPDLLRIKNLFLANGAYAAGLSGSGSTIFGVFEENMIKKVSRKLDIKTLVTQTL